MWRVTSKLDDRGEKKRSWVVAREERCLCGNRVSVNLDPGRSAFEPTDHQAKVSSLVRFTPLLSSKAAGHHHSSPSSG